MIIPATALALALLAPPAGPQVGYDSNNLCSFATELPGNVIFGGSASPTTGKVLLTIIDPAWSDIADGAQEQLDFVLDSATFADRPTADRVLNGRYGRSSFFADPAIFTAIDASKTLTIRRGGTDIATFDLAPLAGIVAAMQSCRDLAAELSSGKALPPPPVPKK